MLSTIVPLRAEYSPDAPSEAPTRLLLKATRAGLDASLPSVGEREVAFYRQAAPLMPGGPLPRCYDAEYSSGRFHLLLEDLSETHMILTEWPIPPSVEACERIVDTWAIFHAFWWRHPRLGREVGTFLDEAALAKIGAEYRGRYERFAETLGDRLWSEARAWRIGRGAADLAYMMAVHWYPERRARLEARLIERYHAALLAHGVTAYGLERLWEDYRLSVIGLLSTPVWQQSFGLHPSIWWPHLHRVLAAFEDLGCAALLS